MRRAKISTYKGTVSEVFAPFHAELYGATSANEVSEEAISALLHEMWGGVTDAKGGGALRIGQKSVNVTAKGSGPKQCSSQFASKQELELPAGLAEAIADVRNDRTAADWVLSGFSDGGGLRMVGSGEGGAEALAKLLDSEGAFYGLVRTTEVIDASTTIKFVFVSFIGSSVPVMRRAKISTYKGTVSEVFAPFHAELYGAGAPEEVTSKAINGLLQSSAGKTGDGGADQSVALVTPRQREERRTEARAAKVVASSSVNKPAAALTVAPEAAKAVAAVRSDSSSTSWALLGFEGNSELCLVGEGEEWPGELLPLLDGGQVLYALLRVSQLVDGRVSSVKFALVSWVGEAVPALRKAKLSTLRGAVAEALSPYHAELLNCSDPKDVSRASVGAVL